MAHAGAGTVREHEQGARAARPVEDRRVSRELHVPNVLYVPGVTYVALLRGINVGGNHIIPMAALAATFERAGFTNVRTYIQSGNVIFDAKARDARALEARIERACSAAHAYAAKVIVRDQDEMAAIVADMPRAWSKPDAATRYNVLYLRHTIDAPEILDRLSPERRLEHVAYRPGVLYWSARPKDVPRTQMAKLSSHEIYGELTVRNLNTTRAIASLCAAEARGPAKRRAAKIERT